MTSDPRAFLAIDRGAATTGAALIGRVEHAWRLLGSVALPARSHPDAAAHLLLARVAAADPELAAHLRVDPERPDLLPAVTVTSTPARRLAVVAASERALAPLVAAAARSGWRTVGASTETTDPLAMSRLVLDGETDGILAGAGDPAGADERGALAELTALVAAAATRRPERLVVLAGAMAEGAAAFGDLNARVGETLLAPAARPGSAGAPLRDLLAALALPVDDARRALGAAAHHARGCARPPRGAHRDRLRRGPAGRGAPGRSVGAGHRGRRDRADRRARTGRPRRCGRGSGPRLDDRRLGSASTARPPSGAADRPVVRRDRRRASRSAWQRLARPSVGWSRRRRSSPSDPAPDLVVAAGGVWSIVPPPAVALALADVLRRPGASGYALDHARLLGPLGSIPDPAERRAVMADLADDLLAPLGTVVTPGGLKTGRSAGSLVVHDRPRGVGGPGPHSRGPVDLVPGGLAMVALPPGATATAEFRFRDGVRLGGRGRHFAVDVSGGLAGLLVDLRDVPMRLPERADRRRELLAAWQTTVAEGASDG